MKVQDGRIAIYDRQLRDCDRQTRLEASSRKNGSERTNDLAWNAVSPFTAAIREDREKDIDIAGVEMCMRVLRALRG